MKMGLYIPTMGRDVVLTLRSIPAALLKQTTLVMPASQASAKSFGARVLAVPDRLKGIAATRQHILEHAKERFICMLDDDMDFCYRHDLLNSPALTTLVRENKEHEKRIMQMFQWLEDALVEGRGHAGISARQGNNNQRAEWLDITRMNNLYAHDRKVLEKHDIRWDRLKLMEDFDVTLRLHALGYINPVSYRYCWNQRMSGAKGGCSTYRTPELQASCARELHRLHGDFVKVLVKTAKSSWKGMSERVDVQIYWLKHFAHHNGFGKNREKDGTVRRG